MRIVLTIIAFSAMICASAYAGLDIVDGMVSAWLFTDGLAVDFVGNNNGVVRGGAGAAEVKGRGPAATDVKGGATGTDVKGGATGTDVKGGATGADVKGGATPADVKGGATPGDVKGGATGADVKGGGGFYGGTALSFDGVDDYVEIPDHPSLHLPEGMTIAAWINVNVGANHAAVAWKGEMIGWGPNFSWRVATTNDTSMTWGRCVEGAEKYFATSDVITTGKWIHVAMTCMAPGSPTNQRAYVDGEDITDVTGQADNLTAEPPFLVFEGSPIEIGVGRGISGEAGNDVYFDGMIDDVVIYNRGLTAAEIVELMNTDLAYLLQDTAVDPVGKIPAVWGKIKQQ